jgi:hypothetical protein
VFDFARFGYDNVVAEDAAAAPPSGWPLPSVTGLTIQPFLTLRVHVLNATLEQAFSTWHAGFRSHVAA